MGKTLLTWPADVSLVLGIAVLAFSVLLVPEVILLGEDTDPIELPGGGGGGANCPGNSCSTTCTGCMHPVECGDQTKCRCTINSTCRLLCVCGIGSTACECRNR